MNRSKIEIKWTKAYHADDVRMIVTIFWTSAANVLFLSQSKSYAFLLCTARIFMLIFQRRPHNTIGATISISNWTEFEFYCCCICILFFYSFFLFGSFFLHFASYSFIHSVLVWMNFSITIHQCSLQNSLNHLDCIWFVHIGFLYTFSLVFSNNFKTLVE